MPFYEYQCQNCGHLFEELQSIKEEPLKKCPNCGKEKLKKLIGSGSSIIFKGSGFYKTDYKSKSSGSASPSADDSSSDTKPISDVKSESKSKKEKKKK